VRAGAVAVLLLAGAGGCRRSLPEDALCKEVGYAIAGRTVQCTGDEALGNARFEAFEDDYTCVDVPVENLTQDTAAPVAPQNLYHCPLALRNLPCELVIEYGDDLDRWLTASPVCAYITSPDGGSTDSAPPTADSGVSDGALADSGGAP
jgi:hypothetical protein